MRLKDIQQIKMLFKGSNKEVALIYLHNLQEESIDSLINEAKRYSTDEDAFQVLYGISQNPDTGDYIFVQNNLINLVNWVKSIDSLINEAKRYSTIEDAFQHNKNYNRGLNERVALKYLHNSQESIDSLINEAKRYSIDKGAFQALDLYKKIALKCLHNTQKSIDSLINEAKKYPIKYKAFQVLYESIDSLINEARKYPTVHRELLQVLYVVALKYLNNSQNSIESLINETRKYTTKYKAFQALYGISQNPDTEDYILVLMWTSGNGKIDYFIQEMQLKINGHGYDDIVFEWIPYSQFNDIKEIGIQIE
ncbi:kinase-like domain-containing protein [Rhizophagus irregularis DAOM 181602=DAOM 197198]|nr:kinase-like domain-containing protein [Rhizophagus irregularis DAOM 181602=DAOM 197198]